MLIQLKALDCKPLCNATIFKMKSDNFKTLQKGLKGTFSQQQFLDYHFI
jgi:hypothetical protein